MHSLRLGGFGGGIPPPMSKSKTSFYFFFLFVRKSSTTGFTKLLFGHMYSYTFFISIWKLALLIIYNFMLFSFQLERGIEVRSPNLKMNVPLTLTGDLRKILCSLLVLSSIGGSFCGTRLFGSILVTRKS